MALEYMRVLKRTYGEMSMVEMTQLVRLFMFEADGFIFVLLWFYSGFIVVYWFYGGFIVILYWCYGDCMVVFIVVL